MPVGCLTGGWLTGWPAVWLTYVFYALWFISKYSFSGSQTHETRNQGQAQLGQLTQKACRLISLNIYEIKAQAAGVLKFDSLRWSPWPLSHSVWVVVYAGYYVCVIVNVVLWFNQFLHSKDSP